MIEYNDTIIYILITIKKLIQLQTLILIFIFVESWQKAKKQNLETYMVTPDKDFAQLVEEDIYMYRPVFGGGYETWGVKEVLDKFEISKTSQVIDFLAMKGDSVDNIPGLPGVGDKTADRSTNICVNLSE